MDIEALAHREAWRYKKSSDPHHSDTYTFNRTTLLEFARKLTETEREACAQVCDAEADRMEQGAQEAIANGEHDEVSAIRSTAWKLSVAANRIRARSNAALTGRGVISPLDRI